MRLTAHSAAFAVVAWLDPLVAMDSPSSGKNTSGKKGGELSSDVMATVMALCDVMATVELVNLMLAVLCVVCRCWGEAGKRTDRIAL